MQRAGVLIVSEKSVFSSGKNALVLHSLMCFILLCADYFSTNPPMSAIRKLLEMMPNAAKFAYVFILAAVSFDLVASTLSFLRSEGRCPSFVLCHSTVC